MKTNSPFIVNLLCSFQTPSKFYLVIDFECGGDMFGYLKKTDTITMNQVRLYVAEIAIALNHLHQMNIIYRDLKPENILLCKDGHLKLTDFGISKILSDPNETTKTLCGTPEYLAPEMIDGKEYSFSVDWWELGCFMYELIVGKAPFQDENRYNLFRNITNKNVHLFPVKDTNARKLIGHLLKKKPEERATFEDIKNSDFFQGFDWEACEQKRLDPPYIPETSSEDDLSNFDPQYTELPVAESLVMPIFERFENFAFSNPQFVIDN